MRENRIKTLRFGALTANSSGVISLNSSWPINGFIQGVQILANNFTATGSLSLTISGTGDSILSFTSGTATSNIAVSGTHYIRAYARGPDNSTLSGLAYTEIPVNDVITLAFAGVGDSKSGLGLNIIYV